MPARVPPTGDLFCVQKSEDMNRQRIKQLEFQMKNNELHAQMATILELAREDIISKGWKKRHDNILKGVVEDLMLVHDRFKASFKLKRHRKQESCL